VTVITFASVKGAPGVTTLACLVGATWPSDRRVMVAECDPSGGDLAARFGLSSKRGWPTFATALRRTGANAAIELHLQQLPGGLDVLVGPGGSDGPDGIRPADELLVRTSDRSAGVWDVLVDVGRLPEGELPVSGWLARSDSVVILLRNDATSLLHIRNRAREIHAVCGDRAALAVVGSTRYGKEEIAEFTGLPVVGNVPFDPVAAAVAAGDQGSERRLSRSFLVNSALHLSQNLCVPDPAPVGAGGPSSSATVEGTEPANRLSAVHRSISWSRRYLDGSVRRLRLRTAARQTIPVPVPVPERISEPELPLDRQQEVSA
jgi:MinD-like ATPase involved in chromosome partitioning or flagellar assembly